MSTMFKIKTWCHSFDASAVLQVLTNIDIISEITCLPVVECMLRFSQSKNKRLSNLAQVFIEVRYWFNTF